MDTLLFPNWLLFAGLFLFLKIYNPTRLYLDNSSALAIAIGLAIALEASDLGAILTPFWIVSVIIFAMFASVPYWLSGMVGSVIQQLLLLNEQSVQDRRFTDESEALSKMSSLMFLMYALDSGVVFRPLLSVISENIEQGANVGFDTLYFYITDSLTMMAMVTGKYIILLLCITICCGYVDLFFKKASLSISTTADIKAITVIIILNLWLLQDQFYVFKQIMKKAGYE
ncbi:type III secretion system apparatus protein VscT2 [Shewanella sp. CG12_big_fil_rev_8_21_14_0_65_47_15]|uniref:type III secretion system apparatus protein VscT2 n=1 Tax=Shewanella sp. CG12_big_fil_rev_8_21_14_0_65_47_15 TaxID=1975537 RepID=UPI000CAEA2C4|nr:type III secretion system apparatus protein VscT2 [Shewanella sp. CG12_big_fil_rev_8_21_14_0_65_47_15]PIW62247.1 MAG: type III secretion system apparatus protein VscT2 [Shewanella sp. CG12_big_fil_rev_8_21_14_0_65_47_15]